MTSPEEEAAAMAALLASLPTTCTPMPMKANVAGYLAANAVLSGIMVTVVGGRIYVRARGPGLAADDWLALLAMVFALVLLIIQGVHSACGSGYDISEAMINLPFTLRLAFAFQLIVIYALASVKISMLIFYLGAFLGSHLSLPLLRRLVIATAALLGAWTLTYTFAVVFTCSPIRAQWDPSLITAKCIDQVPMLQSLIFSNVFLDLVIMALPIPTILGLQMKLSDRIGVLACVLIGLVAVVTGVIRGFYLSTADMRVNIMATIPPSIFMSALEPILSVTCVSLPSLRPMWRRLRGDPSTHNSQKVTGQYAGGSGAGTRGVSNNMSRNKDLDGHFTILGENDDVEMDHMNDESGSERNLTTRGTQDQIVVETKWSVN